MKTFVAAATFYHRLILKHSKSEFNYNDAALACLLVACKAEDTPKKPKEIMCAKANALNPDAPRTHPDDKVSTSTPPPLYILPVSCSNNSGYRPTSSQPGL